MLQKCKGADRIIYLAGLDAPNSEDINAINEYQKQQCSNILNLVKSLYANSITAPIWIVTRGSQAIDNELDSDAVASSCLWGLGNAIAMEHPELWGGIVDLSHKQNEEEDVNLFKIIAAENNKEDRFILREDKIYVPRLQKQSALTETRTFNINSTGSYLITGGLGSLGLKIAAWLAEKGAKNLILLGRSKLNNDAKAVINKLEQEGVTVNTIKADIIDYESLKNLISPSSIKGIVHAAGILDDGLMQGQTWA